MGEYASVAQHRAMVFDSVRNAAYQRAIESLVHPGSVVLDLGAGMGLHGLMAARAGARKVYLVEPEPVLEVTRQIVADNGFDNVELICARAEELELPEQVDLIISVFTGNFLLTEDLLPSLFVARDRCLREGGRMLPDLAQMRVAPICAPDYHEKMVGSWASAHAALQGLDYRAARRYAANSAYYDVADNIEPELMAPASTLLELDLMTAEQASCDHRCEVELNQEGAVHGWLGWFRMRLGDRWLSTSPSAAALHWGQVMLPLDPPLSLAAGDRLTLDLQRPAYGDWTWKTSTAREQQRASTFFATPPALGKLHKFAEQFQPGPTARSAAAAYVLSRFDGATTIQALAAEVFSRCPTEFRDVDEALRFVRQLAGKYG